MYQRDHRDPSSTIKGIKRVVMVFVDLNPPHPADCIYRIKVVDQHMTGFRQYYYGMDWDDNSVEDTLDTLIDSTLFLEFSIYSSMDNHQDFYTQISIAFHKLKVDKRCIVETPSIFKGQKAKKSYVQQFNLLIQKFSTPPIIKTEKKECVHVVSKKKKKVIVN